MRHYLTTFFAVVSIILTSCQSNKVNFKEILSNSYYGKELDFDETPAFQIVDELTKKYPSLIISYESEEQEYFPVSLYANKIKVFDALEYLADEMSSTVTIKNNTVSFKVWPLPVPPYDLSVYNETVIEAGLKETYNLNEIRAAQQILRYASGINIGRVGYAGQIDKTNLAIIILTKSSNPQFYLRQYYSEATFAGKIFLLSGLFQVKSPTFNDEKEALLKASKQLHYMPGGCVDADDRTDQFIEKWIESGKLFKEVNDEIKFIKGRW